MRGSLGYVQEIHSLYWHGKDRAVFAMPPQLLMAEVRFLEKYVSCLGPLGFHLMRSYFSIPNQDPRMFFRDHEKHCSITFQIVDSRGGSCGQVKTFDYSGKELRSPYAHCIDLKSAGTPLESPSWKGGWGCSEKWLHLEPVSFGGASERGDSDWCRKACLGLINKCLLSIY